jgi:hypothetical protein
MPSVSAAKSVVGWPGVWPARGIALVFHHQQRLANYIIGRQ